MSVDPVSSDIARLREFYSRGCYRQAYDAASAFGVMRHWQETPARLIGGRLAMQVGAPKLGRKLHAAAFRSTPSNLEAVYYHARYRFERYGPLSCLRFTRQHDDWADASPDLRADWLALRAFVAGRLRDIDRAEKFLTQAEKLSPNRAWLRVERAAVYEAAERYDDALTAARQALDLQPWFRPAVQATAHLLQRLGQSIQARDFLIEAAGNLESGAVVAQLAALEMEHNDFAAASRSLDRYEELSPLLEDDGRKWLSARRADVAYHLGDLSTAQSHAAGVGEEFYTSFAKQIEHLTALQSHSGGTNESNNASDASIPIRKILPLDLSYDSTPPTVYELLTRFWDEPLPGPGAAPLDGLPDAAERRRIEAAGWHCAEFSIDAATAHALIDAGLPFLITLVEVGVSQTRIVLGYDSLRRSLFLAEGFERKPIEAPLDVLLKRYASTGPRCLLAVPPHQILPDIELPDRAAYDKLDNLQQLLANHEFTDAKRLYDEIRRQAPNHRLTKFAAVAWARGTAHPVLLYDAVSALLADYPHDGTFVISKAAALRDLGRTDERLETLKAEGYATDSDPLIQQSLAQMLLIDFREQNTADWLLRRSLRTRPQAAAGYYLLASQKWERQEFQESLELYRVACCLDEREEQFADAYFRVARSRDQVPEALRLFQQRATRSEVPQPSAVRSLFQALVDRDEADPAFAMLDKAVEKLSPGVVEPRPSINSESTVKSWIETRLFRAEMNAQFGRHEAALAEVEALREISPPVEWHRAAAKIARLKPDLAAALAHTEAALVIDPLWAEGQRNAIALRLETEGLETAREYASTLVKRYPYCYAIVRMRAEFLTPHTGEDSAIRATKDLLELCPHDAWARRQLALVYADRGYDSEAKIEIDRAGATEPHHPSFYAVMAHVHRRDDRTDAALETYRDAIRRNVDHDLAVAELVNLSRGRAEKKAALKFIAEQLHRQPHNGEGLITFRDQTLSLAAADEDADDHAEVIEELHVELEKVLDERPDLWQAWSLEIQQHGLMQRLDESAALAHEATARFPLLAHLWADLARVHAAQGNVDERVEALQHAVAASPGWSPAAMELSDALAENGDHAESLNVLRRAVQRAPLEPSAHVALADRLWTAGESEAALDTAKRAIRLDPGFDAAWRMVAHWCERLDRPDEAVDLARELTLSRPGDSRGWLRLARLLAEPQHNVEALAALDTVIRLEPANVEAHDLKAERLAELGQYEQALAAAMPKELAEELPLVLQGRAAWVEAKRGNYASAIPPMQKLVSVEPEYFWGWQQLAEWYNETGKHANYLEASGELVRLKPDHPLPLTMRGEAKLKTGDRDSGKADLRDALRIAPQFAPAAAILFDACLADDEYLDARKALAVLQEHAVGVEVLTKQIQLACRTGDTEGALRALSEIAETPGDHPPMALQVAMAEIVQAGWEVKSAKVLKEAWQAGGPFNPWAAIYWLDTPDGETSSYDDRLAAMDAVIAAYPKFVAAYDRKAEMLALVGNFDEAIAACHPPSLSGTAPVTLQGRAAWIEARRGRRSQAITLMTGAVGSDPSYLWGWRNLAQWYDADGRHRDCHDAADHMVKLAPDDPLAYGYRGEARRILGDRQGAKEDFRKAFELDPAFEAAGLQLITEQLHSNEADDAEYTLSRLQEHSTSKLVQVRGVQIAAAQGNLQETRKRFGKLLAETGLPAHLLTEAVGAFDDAGWTAEADDELTRAVTGPNASPASAAVWAERHLKADNSDRVLESLPGLFERNVAAGREAVLTYAVMTARGGRTDAAAAAVHRFADALRADDAAWAAAGAALSAAGLHALAVNWLSDWRVRLGVEPAMLRPLADSLRALDRDHDALAVCREGIELGGEPPADLLGWLALAAACDGRTTDAAQSLAQIERIGLPDGTRLLVAMAEALVMIQQAGPDAKAAAFTEAKDHLRTATGSCDASDLPLGISRWYLRVVNRLASDSGLFAAKFWAWWQRLRPWAG